MTLTKMSPAHEYSVCSIEKSIQNEERVYPSGTHHPDDADIGRILKPGHACCICRRITAPVAQKSEYLRFIYHNFYSLTLSCFPKSLDLGDNLIICKSAHTNSPGRTIRSANPATFTRSNNNLRLFAFPLLRHLDCIIGAKIFTDTATNAYIRIT